MNPLYLSGFGVSINVDGARLIVKDGFLEPDSSQRVYEFQPRRMRYDSVVIDAQTGSVSLAAIKWLMRHGVPLYILDYNGTLLSSTLPKDPVNGPLKIAQIKAYEDQAKRFYIAKKLVEAKAMRTVEVLGWLAERHGKRNLQIDLNPDLERLYGCVSLPRLLSIEGRIADYYWRYLQKVLPDSLGFTSRMHESHQMNASDPVNALFNYGYAILESECRKALNSIGLEPSVGFLHESRQTKYPLVYDLQEPFRWLTDTTVIECLEYNRFSKRDFYRLDNYVLRLKPEAVKKLLVALRLKFNSAVRYRDKFYAWDVVIRQKAQELATHIVSKRNSRLAFEEPRPLLRRDESLVVRKAILGMTAAEARKCGIRRNTLWYAQRRVVSGRFFNVYRKVREKMESSYAQ